MTKTIYLAGPIMDCDSMESRDWRKFVKNELSDSNVLFLDPMRNNLRDEEIEHRNEIVQFCKKDIVDCDIILANCWKPSVGTSMEIIFGNMKHKIIIVIGDYKKVSPWIHVHSTKVLPTVEEGVKYIKDRLLK